MSEFENQCSGNNLIMFHQNIRSSNQNFDCLFAFINNIEKYVDVIVMSETWFSVTSKCSIEGYNSFHSYRDNRTGGGVSIFIRKSLRAYCISEKSIISDDVETCDVELSCGDNSDENMFICRIYRPHNS